MAEASFELDRAQYRALNAAIRNMDKDSKGKLKDEVSIISMQNASVISRAYNLSPYPKQAEKVAASIKTRRGQKPSISLGGNTNRYSGGAVAGQVVYGNEFGANFRSDAGRFPTGGRRFPFRSPRLGRGSAGYWIFPTLRRMQPEITKRWKNSVDRVLDNWSKGAGGGVG